MFDAYIPDPFEMYPDGNPSSAYPDDTEVFGYDPADPYDPSAPHVIDMYIKSHGFVPSEKYRMNRKLKDDEEKRIRLEKLKDTDILKHRARKILMHNTMSSMQSAGGSMNDAIDKSFSIAASNMANVSIDISNIDLSNLDPMKGMKTDILKEINNMDANMMNKGNSRRSGLL